MSSFYISNSKLTLTTDSFDIAYDTYLYNMGKVVLFDYRFIWSEMAYRYVVKYRV